MDRPTQLRRLGLFDARVPRYTSYPTANHFSDRIGPEDTAAWIAAIPEGSDISLYIHIPFCRRLCWFCACRTQGTSKIAPVETYLGVLKKELRLLDEMLPKGVRLSRLHWGGGTPTLLSADMITDLAEAIVAVAPLSDTAEFSVEIDPNEIDDSRMDALTKVGMNRASIGVQDFDPEIQTAIGRMQSFEVTKAAVDGLRKRGLRSLNCDILYGLPHQTESGIADSVQKLLSLSPDRVALYGYAHVPWMARRQTMIPSEALPTPEARLALFEVARKLFVWDGYSEIGIDHFARPGDGLDSAEKNGTLKRNFQGYTDDPADVLIGVGASAISRYPQGFAQNNPSTSRYHSAIEEGHLATSRGHEFTEDDRIRAEMIERLMCTFGLDIAEVATRLGVDKTEISTRLDGIEAAFPGAVGRTAAGIKIRQNARSLTRMVARYIDAYAVNQERHSPAI